jgi:dTDP-4-dehydrorhamnose reductase
MRIVITGHKGQLGKALQLLLADNQLLGLDLPEADVTDPDSVIDAVVKFRPEVVIHTAAMTDVDGCEQDPELAFRVNVLGTQNIALACGRIGATMIHISTNDVFDGSLGRSYYEWDSPSPRSTYARSKAAAEFYVTGGATIS